MDPIVKRYVSGKHSWRKEELVESPTILRDLRNAEAHGLILLKVGRPSKSRDAYGVPIMAVVLGLTAAGQAMADAG